MYAHAHHGRATGRSPGAARTGVQLHLDGGVEAREAREAAPQLRGGRGQVDAAETGRVVVAGGATPRARLAAALVAAVLVVVGRLLAPARATGSVHALWPAGKESLHCLQGWPGGLTMCLRRRPRVGGSMWRRARRAG